MSTNRSDGYNGASNFNALLTPLTFLISYFNSAINPLLYAFLSKNFRKGMRELLCCSYKKSKSVETQQRIILQVTIKKIDISKNNLRIFFYIYLFDFRMNI